MFEVISTWMRVRVSGPFDTYQEAFLEAEDINKTYGTGHYEARRIRNEENK